MITKLNHVILAVRDLEFAIEQFTRLGFCIGARGSQASIGTRFANVQLGQTYIELIEATDPLLCMRALANADIILRLLDMHDSAMVGFGLTTTDISALYTHLQGTELGTIPPTTIQRKQADNQIVNLQMFAPGGLPYRRPWPLFYQWLDPHPQHTHFMPSSNRVTDIAHVIVGVCDFDTIINLYTDYFDLQIDTQQHIPALAARYAKFYLGAAAIDLVSPTGEGILQREIDEVGEGVCMLVLAVDDIAQSWDFFAQQHVRLYSNVLGPETILIDPQETLGVRIILAQKGVLQL